jgi:hypothetical protein
MKKLILFGFAWLSISSQAQITPFQGIFQLDQCDFTAPCPYVVIPNTPNNLWVRDTSEKIILAHSGDVMITDTLHNYPTGTNSSFEIHWPTWNNYPLSFIMSFHHSMDSDSLLDGGIIEVSRDYGATWTNVIEDQTNILFFSNELYTSVDTLFTGETGFSGSFQDRYTEIEWIWEFPIKQMMPTDTMYYRFRFISDAVENNKEGWMISDIQFSFADLGSGIEELGLFDFSLYPNPSNGTIHIDCSLNMEKAFLRDLNGNLVSSELIATKKVLNYSGLSKGIYFLQLQSADQQLSRIKRLIID